MQLTKLTSITAALAAIATAIPSVAPLDSLTARDTSNVRRGNGLYGIYECSGNHFSGTCHWTQLLKSDGTKCFNRKYGEQQSIGPDPGVTCDMFEYADCKKVDGFLAGFTYPGTGDCPNYKPFQKPGLTECPMSWSCRVTA